MLSLKNSSYITSPSVKKVLTDLPSEVLDLVLRHIYYASGEHISSVIPASLTSRLLRLSACPILFEVLTIVLEGNVIKRRSWTFLQHLFVHAHLLKHVRCLQIQEGLVPNYTSSSIESDSARFGQGLSKKNLLDCLDRMTGLRSVRFYHISDITFDVLGRLPVATSIDIIFDLSHARHDFTWEHSCRIEGILARSLDWRCSFSFPPSRYNDWMVVSNSLGSCRCKAINWLDNWVPLQKLAEVTYEFTHLEELHVSSRLLAAQDHLLRPGFIPWHSLKRLHVEGDRQIKHLLTDVIDQLTSLTSLRLHASTSNVFHDNCLESSLNRTQHHYPVPPSTSLSSVSTVSLTGTVPLPYTQLPKLRHLELRGICSHLPITHITTPTLRTLKLILPEYYARMQSLTEARPPSDLKSLSDPAILPHLTHLELHVGSLENLWHPTAIPGVEVDPEVYTTLALIAAIPNLCTLRLFPPYVPTRESSDLSALSRSTRPRLANTYQRQILPDFNNNNNRPLHHHISNARQPISDEQSIKIFHHLHTLRPSLHTLSIAATFHKLHGFSPMSWTVRDIGSNNNNNNNTIPFTAAATTTTSTDDNGLTPHQRPRRPSQLAEISKTQLITRQAEKDYELVQIWIGRRRMTTYTRRFSFRKPFLRPLSGSSSPFDHSSGDVRNDGEEDDSWVFGVDDPL